MMSWLWLTFMALPWWAMVLWVVYAVYFVVRTWAIWDAVSYDGIAKGYKKVFVGNDKHFRLYHLLRTLIDIPPMILGLFFPVLQKIFSLKIYTFKEEKKGDK